MHSVAETSIFTRRADALLSRADRVAVINMLATDPLCGDLVPGLGGIRKVRFAPAGRGKSGGFRVVHYYAGAEAPVLALLIYGKGEQENFSPAQCKAMLAIIAAHRTALRTQRGGVR